MTLDAKTLAWLRKDREEKEQACRTRCEAHAPERTPQAGLDAMWNHAWEEGHSEGYARVEDIYQDLCDIVRACQKG